MSMSRDEIYDAYISEIKGEYWLNDGVPGVSSFLPQEPFTDRGDAITAVQLAMKAAAAGRHYVQSAVCEALGIRKWPTLQQPWRSMSGIASLRASH